MAKPKEELEKMKKEKYHALSTLCFMNSSSDFYPALVNSSFNNITSHLLACIVLYSFMMTEEYLMEEFYTSKSEAKKMRTLAISLHCLQLKGEASLGFHHITKEEYDDFKSQLHN